MLKSNKSMLLKGLCLAAFCVAGTAQASQEFIFKKGGFETAEQCEVKMTEDIALRILQDANPPKDLRALINVSADSSAFKLVSVSSDQDSAKNRQRLSGVELTDKSGRDLAEFVLEITGKTKAQIGSSGIALQNSYFQVSTEDGQYVVYSCGEKQFVAFDVYVANQVDAVARVGVSTSDLSLFKKVQIRTADEAEVAVKDREKKESIDKKADKAAQKNVTFRSAPPKSLTLDKKTQEKLAALKAESKKETVISTVPVLKGEPEQVVCGTSSIAVQNQDLSKPLFELNSGDQVLVVQSFGQSKQTVVVNGETKTFVQVRALNRKDGANTGWVLESAVKHSSQCASAEQQPEILLYDITAASGSDSSGRFPTIKRPTTSYLEGMRRFKANRSKGKRLHAACDLYRKKNEVTVAVLDGKVVRGLREFYEGTFSLELRVGDGRIMRYGELTGKKIAGSKEGKTVKQGGEIGYIGKVNSGCCEPMLHFEIYKGTGKGPLSVRGNKFGRRGDLIDPTKQLQAWEKATYGKSY